MPPSLPTSPAFEAPAGGVGSNTIYPGMPGLGEALRAQAEQAESDLAAAQAGAAQENPGLLSALRPDEQPNQAEPIEVDLGDSPSPVDLGQPELVTEELDEGDGLLLDDEAEPLSLDTDAIVDEVESYEQVEPIEAERPPAAQGARQPPHSPAPPPSSVGHSPAPGQPLSPGGDRGFSPDPLPNNLSAGAQNSGLADDLDEAGGGSIIGRMLFALIVVALVAAGTLSYVAWSETGDWNPLPLIQSRLGG